MGATVAFNVRVEAEWTALLDASGVWCALGGRRMQSRARWTRLREREESDGRVYTIVVRSGKGLHFRILRLPWMHVEKRNQRVNAFYQTNPGQVHWSVIHVFVLRTWI